MPSHTSSQETQDPIAQGPILQGSRIVEVDMVRGFALFGVLLVNLFNFGAYSIAWDSETDRMAFAFMRVFFESKFWTLFSILFGFGFGIQLNRSEARGRSLTGLYLRRLVVLFLIGAVHALLYDGDILMLYAELGLALLVVRRAPTRWLLALAVALLLVFPATRFVSAREQPDPMDEVESVADARADLEEDRRTHVYATGSLAEVAMDNASAIPANPLEDVASPESGLAVFAMFLLGFVIQRSSVLGDVAAHAARIAQVRAWGLGLGLGAMATERALAAATGYAVFREQQAGAGIQLAGDLLFTFGTVALSLGYGAALVLAAQTPRATALLAPLAATGRMALTVYLSQTLLFTTLFYGYGFGQVFRLGPVAVSVWAVVIFSVQVLACQWWTKRFRYGPVEWLWRSLTYRRWRPLRLPPDTQPNA